MNPKSFPHPEQAPLGAGAGVADRRHSSRSFFLTLPHRHWQTNGCCPQGGTRPAGATLR